jgi:hypothetical protein
MEACYMVSYFVSDNFDYDVEDVSNCPLAPHLTVMADSPNENRGKFKPFPQSN